MNTTNQITRYHILIKCIAFSIAIHAVSLLTMILFIEPGLNTQVTVLQRAYYVAASPWIWRLAWLPWQITALSDLLVSVAIIRFLSQTPSRHGQWASWLALLCTFIAIVPDQWGELLFVHKQVLLAQEVLIHGDTSSYLKAESHALLLTGTYGATGYILMSIAWLFSATQSAGSIKRHKAFCLLGIICLSLFSISAIANWYALSHENSESSPSFTIVFVANALAFPLLLLWMSWLGAVFGDGHHMRHFSSDTKQHAMVSPFRGWRGQLAKLGSAAGLRDIIRCLMPLPIISSDISDVVYLNWRIPESRILDYLPNSLSADVVDGHTWLTVLSYRHGNLGPRFLGPLRRFFPSPLQSNWRFYLSPKEGEANDAIYFIKTMISNPIYAPLIRLFSDGLPAHLPKSFQHSHKDNSYSTEICAGQGSSEDLKVKIQIGGELKDKHHQVVQYLVEQNCAVYINAGLGRVGKSRISIPIDVRNILLADLILFECAFLAPIIGEAECFAFVVPEVKFSALGEEWTTDYSFSPS